MEIDVSKCKNYYKHTKICLTRSDYMGRYKNCSDIPTNDCYYKQLQQLKAENEGLQSLNDFNVQKIETLEAENKELEKQLQQLNQLCKQKTVDNFDLIKENEELKENIRTSCRYYAPGGECALTAHNCCGTSKCIERLHQCINEIEDICKKSWHDSGITIDYFKRNNYSWKQHQIRSLISRFEQIIQKIKEVKGDD